MNAEKALDKMRDCFDKDGVLSISTANKEGSDIMVQATIIKPRSDMKYEEMGMVVWFWGYLCIKSIDKDSVWKNTVLNPTDHIVSINDIECEKMSPEGFAQCINEIPGDITITVLRRKQRVSGRFG